MLNQTHLACSTKKAQPINSSEQVYQIQGGLNSYLDHLPLNAQIKHATKQSEKLSLEDQLFDLKQQRMSIQPLLSYSPEKSTDAPLSINIGPPMQAQSARFESYNFASSDNKVKRQRPYSAKTIQLCQKQELAVRDRPLSGKPQTMTRSGLMLPLAGLTQTAR